MRKCRQRLLAPLHEAFEAEAAGGAPLKGFTVVLGGWLFPHGSLADADPKALRKQFRRHLECVELIPAEGLLFAGLHGSLNEEGYQLHYHGIVSGEKVDLMKDLGERLKSKSRRIIDHPLETSDIGDLFGWLSYCMKSYWPYRHEYTDANNTSRKQKRRIPHPHHEEVLVWMAKQDIRSLLFHSGFSIPPW